MTAAVKTAVKDAISAKSMKNPRLNATISRLFRLSMENPTTIGIKATTQGDTMDATPAKNESK